MFQEILSSLLRNKLRTLLTGFAVAWGIFMLIVLLGAGNGLIHAFEENASQQALNVVDVHPGTTTLPYAGFQEGRKITLDNQDMASTGRAFPDIVLQTGAVLKRSGVNISYRGEYVNLALTGVFPDYTEVERVKTVQGRFVNAIDLRERRKTICLHRRSAEILFGKAHVDPIGQYVNAGGLAYQVVGLYDDRGDQEPSEAFVPFTTLQTICGRGDELDNILFTVRGLETEAQNDAFEADYRRVLAANHTFDPQDDGAIWLWNRLSNFLTIEDAMFTLRIAIWVIGLFTLLSGIVGVSNIMLITVRERTHEFGIRKAIGARPMSILWLIIAESVTITTLFGYVGMLAGIGATEWMSAYFGSQTMEFGGFQQTTFSDPTVDVVIALEATLTLIVAGTLAGLFPARKAAMIRPIEALNQQ